MRFASVVVALLVVPSLASAQFTTVLTPPKKEPAPVATTPEPAARETVARRSLTNMKAWVDSAAAALDVRMPAPDTIFGGDSTVVAPEPARAPAPPPETPREETLTFRDGAPAPDTATDLPLLAVLALCSLGVGAALLWRPRA